MTFPKRLIIGYFRVVKVGQLLAKVADSGFKVSYISNLWLLCPVCAPLHFPQKSLRNSKKWDFGRGVTLDKPISSSKILKPGNHSPDFTKVYNGPRRIGIPQISQVWIWLWHWALEEFDLIFRLANPTLELLKISVTLVKSSVTLDQIFSIWTSLRISSRPLEESTKFQVSLRILDKCHKSKVTLSKFSE